MRCNPLRRRQALSTSGARPAKVSALVQPPKTPPGVEHPGGVVGSTAPPAVQPPKTPPGVEHTFNPAGNYRSKKVQPPKTPPGVEHFALPAAVFVAVMCNPLRRRQALSTCGIWASRPA